MSKPKPKKDFDAKDWVCHKRIEKLDYGVVILIQNKETMELQVLKRIEKKLVKTHNLLPFVK